MKRLPLESRNILGLCLLAFAGLSEPLTAHPIPADEVAGWFDRSFVEILTMSASSEGAEIFPLWSSHEDEPSVGGVLLRARSEIDIGIVVSAVLEIYLNPDDLTPRAIAFEPEVPIPLKDVEEYFGASAEVRLCRPANVEIPLDAPLIPADAEGAGVVEQAVFLDIRMIAEMFEEKGSVSRLRWVNRGHSLEGCP